MSSAAAKRKAKAPGGWHTDPVGFAAHFWPSVRFYSKQREILRSLVTNDETVVPAGHMLGKDFVAGFSVLWFFLTRTPCRVVTTSADHSQLEAVLWGEIRQFMSTCRFPLEADAGGPLIVNHLHLRRAVPKGWRGEVEKGKREDGTPWRACGLSYVIARVAAKGEGMQGHHIASTGDGIPRTYWLADESSGVDDRSYEASDTWADRKLMIGNCYGSHGFFKEAVKGGDVLAKGGRKPAAEEDLGGGRWR